MTATETRFPLGQVVSRPGALDLLEQVGYPPAYFLDRHQAGDWGAVPAEDARENELSLRHGYRIMSAYPVGAARLLTRYLRMGSVLVATMCKPAAMARPPSNIVPP